MSKLLQRKRVLICTLAALISGLSGAYIGSQISWKIHSQKCQQPWGLKTLCNAWVTPGAIWQGSTTGLCLGTVLGGVISAWAISKTEAKQKSVKPKFLGNTNTSLAESVSLFADELELTNTQRQVLRRFLVLLMVKLAAENTASASQSQLSLDELQRLLRLSGKLDNQELWEQAYQMFLQLSLEEQISIQEKIPQTNLPDTTPCLRHDSFQASAENLSEDK